MYRHIADTIVRNVMLTCTAFLPFALARPASASDSATQEFVGAWIAQGVPVVRAPGIQSVPAMIADGSGGAFVAWQDDRNGPASRIYAQRIDGLGNPLWTMNGLPVCLGGGGSQTAPVIAEDGIGGVFVAWTDTRSGTKQVLMGHLDSNGTAGGWPAAGVRLFDSLSTPISDPQLVPDGAGGTYVLAGRTGIITEYRAQLLNAGGGVRPGWSRAGLRLVRSSRPGTSTTRSHSAQTIMRARTSRIITSSGMTINSMSVTTTRSCGI